MRIAQVAPLYERVPPRYYGGTERVVSYLTEALVEAGHQVTLFASGDSLTQAKLISACEQALRLDPDCIDELAYHLLQLEQVFQRAHYFDIIHFHLDYLHFPHSRRERVAQVTTLHGRLDIPTLGPLYEKYCDMPVISISVSGAISISSRHFTFLPPCVTSVTRSDGSRTRCRLAVNHS